MSARPVQPLTYSPLAIAIHWIVASCVVVLVPVGLIMSRMDESPAEDRLLLLHESFGILVLALTIVLIGMRMAGRLPDSVEALTPFERFASRMAHTTLYFLLILTPLIGWLGVSAYGETVSLFGLVNLPSLLVKDEPLSDEIFAVHLACALLIVFVVIAHVLGAIVHGVRRDGVVQRMRPF
jgi:cytochrome b561